MSNVNNTFCWADIPVTQLDRAISFYSTLLDTKIDKVQEGGFEFGLLPHTQENVSGCLSAMDDRKPSQEGTLVYLNVEGRLEEAIAAAKKNGGKILKEKEQIGPYGFRAVILDSEGNSVALYSKNA